MAMERLRKAYLKAVCQHVLGYQNGALNIADANLESSVKIARGILDSIGDPPCPEPPEGSDGEILFASLTRDSHMIFHPAEGAIVRHLNAW